MAEKIIHCLNSAFNDFPNTAMLLAWISLNSPWHSRFSNLTVIGKNLDQVNATSDNAIFSKNLIYSLRNFFISRFPIFENLLLFIYTCVILFVSWIKKCWSTATPKFCALNIHHLPARLNDSPTWLPTLMYTCFNLRCSNKFHSLNGRMVSINANLDDHTMLLFQCERSVRTKGKPVSLNSEKPRPNLCTHDHPKCHAVIEIAVYHPHDPTHVI